MLIFALFLFLCDLVASTNKIVTITRYTTTTICPIKTTFTGDGITVTATKWTTSEVTVAIVQTVIVPGPTATHTQVSVVNVTKILTSSDIITLPTVELTKRITSFATVAKTPAITMSTSTSCPSTTKWTFVSSSNPTPKTSGRTRMISSSSTPDHTNESKAPSSSLTPEKGKTTLVAAVTSDQSSLGGGSTTVFESQPLSKVVGIDTGNSTTQDQFVPTTVATTNMPTKTSNGDTQPVPLTGAGDAKTGNGETHQVTSTGTRDSPNGKAQPVPELSQPSLVIESISSEESFGLVRPTGLPVISKGTMLYLPAMFWLATIACVAFGMVWGAS